jgi:hypothetical protein
MDWKQIAKALPVVLSVFAAGKAIKSGGSSSSSGASTGSNSGMTPDMLALIEMLKKESEASAPLRASVRGMAMGRLPKAYQAKMLSDAPSGGTSPSLSATISAPPMNAGRPMLSAGPSGNASPWDEKGYTDAQWNADPANFTTIGQQDAWIGGPGGANMRAPEPGSPEDRANKRRALQMLIAPFIGGIGGL